MEEETQNSSNNSSSSSMSKIILPTVIIALIVFSVIGFYLYQSNNVSNETAPSPSVVQGSPAALPSSTASDSAAYRDGTYSVVGNYVSPGGPRELNVTIVLTDGVISEAEVEGTATDATSQRFQGEFVGGFAPMVVGKSIDEVNLTKVAGSSLSPKGFNDAIEKIKAEAMS